jgi:ATP-dependent helicase/nuclease subunit A
MNTTTTQPADAAVRRDVLDVERSFLIKAPAGSGKTELLTQRLLRCLACVNRPEEVLFLTFTNKAVSVGYNRVTTALQRGTDDTTPEAEHERTTWDLARQVLKRDQELGWDLLKNPSRLRIMTFDSLNAQLAAQLPVLSGFGGPSSIEENPTILYHQAIYSLFAEMDDPTLDAKTRDALSALLAFSQNRVSVLLPLLSDLLGKRDQWLGQLHQHTSLDMEAALAQLVNDTLERAYRALGAGTGNQLVGVFSATGDPLHTFTESLDHWPEPRIENLDTWRQLVQLLLTQGSGSDKTLRKKFTKANGFMAKLPHTKEANEILADLQARADRDALESALSDVMALPATTYPVQLETFRQALSLALDRLVAHLRLMFESAGKVDFIEVSLRALAALGEGEAINDALLKLDYTIKHLLLDEAQDISYLQYHLIQKLTSGWEYDDGRTLCIVGDPQQSIYAFRQAEVRLFMELWQQQAFHDLPLECVRLTTNFRSDAKIVNWFNAAFEEMFPKTADLYRAAVTFTPSTAFHPETDEAGVFIHPVPFSSRRHQEPGKIIDIIRTIQARDPAGSIAVLVRSRGHARDLIPYLQEAGITYSSQDIDPLPRKPAVSDVVCLIRALWHPHDRTAWVGLLRAPFVGLSMHDLVVLLRGQPTIPVRQQLTVCKTLAGMSDEGATRIARLLAALDEVESDHLLTDDLHRKAFALWYQLGGPACITASETPDIDTLFQTLQQHCQAGELTSIEAFLHTLSGLYASPESGEVQILTVHKSKGLEFDHVICPGLDRTTGGFDTILLHHRRLPGGYLIAPNPGKHSPAESDESRLFKYMGRVDRQAQQQEIIRLLYVAITRARNSLHLVGQVKPRTNGVRPHSGSFLSFLWPAVSPAFSGITQTSPDTDAETTVGLKPVLVPRIDPDWARPVSGDTYVPRTDIAHLPSEMVIRDSHTLKPVTAGHDDESVARLIGIMYHAFMERISKTGITAWDQARIMEQRRALMAGCRRMGMPEPAVDGAVDEILSLVHNTLNCDTGRWILSHHPYAASELQLAGYLEGKWVAAAIDRIFHTEEACWVIDYKTGGTGLKPEDVTQFIQYETQRYQGQMQRYIELVRANGTDLPIRAGFYFPAIQQMAEITVSPS